MVRKRVTKGKKQGKVRNATPTSVDGIKFKSKLEAYCYIKLKEAKINATYESKRYVLIPNFNYNGEKIRAMTYLPDFVAKDFIIECKGLVTDSFPLRFKVFKYTLYKDKNNIKIYLVRNHKQIDDMILDIKANKYE